MIYITLVFFVVLFFIGGILFICLYAREREILCKSTIRIVNDDKIVQILARLYRVEPEQIIKEDGFVRIVNKDYLKVN